MHTSLDQVLVVGLTPGTQEAYQLARLALYCSHPRVQSCRCYRLPGFWFFSVCIFTHGSRHHSPADHSSSFEYISLFVMVLTPHSVEKVVPSPNYSLVRTGDRFFFTPPTFVSLRWPVASSLRSAELIKFGCKAVLSQCIVFRIQVLTGWG